MMVRLQWYLDPPSHYELNTHKKLSEFPFLDGDVPRSPSYGIHNSLYLTAKLLK